MLLLLLLSKPKLRSLLPPFIHSSSRMLLSTATASNNSALPSASASAEFFPFAGPAVELDLDASQLADSFKGWFLGDSLPLSLLDRVYAALSSATDDRSLDAALSSLRLPLSESLVIRILRHCPHPSVVAPSSPSEGERDLLLLRLKFFDWSGRQRRGPYRHTGAAYHAVFRLLSRARLASVLLDWLRLFRAQHPHARQNFGLARLHDTLVVGYAVAGRPELALALFARMRFQGLDLDRLSYHVLLDALVEAAAFDAAESLLSQIHARGIADHVTAAIRIKSLCLQGRVDGALRYLHDLQDDPATAHLLSNHLVGTLVHALCVRGRFDDAARIVDQLRTPHACTAWVVDLVAAGRLDAAMGFMQTGRTTEYYIPDSLHYNALICRMLRRNRLREVYDLMVEMRERGVPPDQVTMNAALCFFCKAGMVDVALQLYNSRAELGLTPTARVYNCLVAALCRTDTADDVFRVVEESMQRGYFPGRRTFNVLATVLCREGKLDKVHKLLDAALQRNMQPVTSVFARYMAALCKAGEVEEACLVPQMVSKQSTDANLGRYKHAYTSLINAFIQLRRVDVLSGLIIEMQDNGHVPGEKLYREVVCCLCEMGRFDEVLSLLDKQLERKELDRRTCYNYFISGASHAKKPELAREVYNRMESAGISPQMDTNILMLQSYLKSRLIGDALSFFYFLREKREPSTKLYNIFISGLCEAEKPEQAVVFWKEARGKGLIPSLQCYEELVLALCSSKDYDIVVKVLEDFRQTGRPVSSFLCNVLLLHTLKSQELLHAWVQLQDGTMGAKSEAASGVASLSGRLMLGQLIAAFSGGIRMKENLENLDEVIEKFFPVDIFTYNMLLRGFGMAGRMDYACNLFHKIRKKGCEPNRWTFDIVVHGFCKQGRRKDAERWMEEMYRNGFHPTWYTMRVYNNMP